MAKRYRQAALGKGTLPGDCAPLGSIYVKLFHRLAATCCLVILTLSLTSGRYSLLPGGLQLSRGLASTVSLTFRDEFDGPGRHKEPGGHE